MIRQRPSCYLSSEVLPGFAPSRRERSYDPLLEAGLVPSRSPKCQRSLFRCQVKPPLSQPGQLASGFSENWPWCLWQDRQLDVVVRKNNFSVMIKQLKSVHHTRNKLEKARVQGLQGCLYISKRGEVKAGSIQRNQQKRVI